MPDPVVIVAACIAGAVGLMLIAAGMLTRSMMRLEGRKRPGASGDAR